MRKAFTLVEMLVVVAILAILMSIAFRISSVTSVDAYRTDTINRLQRLENCLSGYYAAFGSYPPVKVHGSRDIYVMDDDGNRNENIWGWSKIGESAECKAWNQVKRACAAQPIGCSFPFSEDDRDAVEAFMEELRTRTMDSEYKYYYDENSNPNKAKFLAGFSIGNPDAFAGDLWKISDWNTVKLFKFGVMSYLLPRYLVMMNGDAKYFGSGGTPCKQWDLNNDMPSDPYRGKTFDSWKTIRNNYLRPDSDTQNKSDIARIANIPSQAATARWMPNLEGICDGTGVAKDKIFGIDIMSDDWRTLFNIGTDTDSKPPDLDIYAPGKSNSGYYILDSITVRDGWGNDFYYYSREPYQSYTLWSAGANGRTFPPWLAIEKLDSQARKCVLLWTEDDIIRMKN